MVCPLMILVTNDVDDSNLVPLHDPLAMLVAKELQSLTLFQSTRRLWPLCEYRQHLTLP